MHSYPAPNAAKVPKPPLVAMLLHTSESTLLPSRWQLFRLPSTVAQRRLLKGRLDSEHRAVLVLIGGWCGFGGLETSCLYWSDIGGRRKSPSSLTLKNVQANPAQLVDIGMVDLGEESDLWWGHRVIVRQEKLKLENAG